MIDHDEHGKNDSWHRTRHWLIAHENFPSQGKYLPLTVMCFSWKSTEKIGTKFTKRTLKFFMGDYM